MTETTTSSRLHRDQARSWSHPAVVAGAAVGAWAASRLRSSDQPTPTPETDHRLIDWEHARSIAINMNRSASSHLCGTPATRCVLSRAGRQAIPVVECYVGISLPNSAVSTHAFDRVDWINANIDAFRDMLAPFEALAQDESNKNPASQMMAGLNRRVVSLEVGVLLGYLSRRVLGQYDIALLGREQIEGGRLYYVEPNIRHIESSLGLPENDFRMWLALHETTHVFEFEGFPWVRPYFNSMLEEYFGYLKDDAALRVRASKTSGSSSIELELVRRTRAGSST